MRCVFCKHWGKCPVFAKISVGYLPMFFTTRGFVCKKHEPDFLSAKQYKKRTGNDWPDDAPVWYAPENVIDGGWELARLGSVKTVPAKTRAEIVIVCATEAGPPPDDWRPEEEV